MAKRKRTMLANAPALDSGINSRKLWYAVGTSVSIMGGGLMAAFIPAFAPEYQTAIGGLLGALALYLGGNISNKWVLNKTLGPMQPLDGAAPAESTSTEQENTATMKEPLALPAHPERPCEPLPEE